MENRTYLDTTHKLVHGHEAWMEDFIAHYHAFDPIMAMVKWGHNCTQDGLVKQEQMVYTVCAPDGTITEVQCDLGDENCYDLTADTLEEGYYTFIASYDHCWAKCGESEEDYKFGDRTEHADALEVRNYHQYATLVVPVGHFHAQEMYEIPSMRLSVLPTTGSEYQASHDIQFRAVLEGKPLANHDAIVVQLLDEGTKEIPVTSDENGIITFKPETHGTYVIIVRASDDVKDADGRYEGTSFTATHSFRVAEHNHHHHDHEDEGGHEHHHSFDDFEHEHEHEHHHDHDHHDHDHHDHDHHDHEHCCCGHDHDHHDHDHHDHHHHDHEHHDHDHHEHHHH